jgi:ABC-type molybdate transport system ATPase subunit
MEVGCGGLPIIVPHDGDPIQRIAVFPRDIYVSDTKPPGPEVNRFKGAITSIESARDAVRLQVKTGENSLLVEIPHHMFENLNLTTGKEVFLILKLRRIRIYEKKDL